ncbi:sensor histidine kinase [Algoriphagus persicinus]|uniref:sensor histidine kinase n=1 Tax=Algoriphagus persicinus TaxID=3108754 RepID=UPI002B3BD606|nr:PAS domain-containing sensor histidine kinase [Algoriphagus sp. E1-3-M2]MEB2785251.1 PAS domain-containing sensor histidine kinase [Algoriphagus sp. E1-3-M2]
MVIENKTGNRNFAVAVALVCLVFITLLIGSGRNMDFSPAYLLVIVYLLWMQGRGKHYYFLGAIITALMALGYLLTTQPESRSTSLLYSNLMMVILVWVVIYFIYRQKKLFEKLGKNSEQLNAMFENATEGIMLVDDQGRILILNKFAEGLFGYSRSDLVGQPVEKLIPKRFSHRHETHRNSYHKDPHNRPMGLGMELYALHSEGQEFPVEISLGYYEVDGRQTVIVFVNDITEREKVRRHLILEKELTQKLNEELESRVQERTNKMEEALFSLENSNNSLREIEKDLSKALNREKELGELKSRFVTMASHEFRTPLTTILSSVFLLENTPEDDQNRIRDVHLSRIRKSSKNLTAILNDFLSLSKLEEGELKQSYSLTDVSALSEEIIDEFSVLKKPDQTICYTHTGSIDPQLVDRQFLRNILINLLSNAIKFSYPDGKIDLISQIENNQLKITVIDQGIGIPKEDQEHLFSRFFRAGNAQNIDGTGLGLNIVKKYVDLMRGNISLKSGANKGTTFVVTIPIFKNDSLQVR